MTDADVLPHLPLVRHIARSLWMPWLDLDELVSDGTVGLVQALATWDPGHGASLNTWIHSRVRWAIIDGLRAADWQSRALRTGKSLLVRVEMPDLAAPAVDVDDLLDLDAEVGRLDERHRMVVRAWFGDGRELADIGEQLGVSESRACQIKGEALRVLRRRLAA